MNVSLGISQLLSKVLSDFLKIDFFLSAMISSLIVSEYLLIFKVIQEYFYTISLFLVIGVIVYYSNSEKFLGLVKKLLVRMRVIHPTAKAEIQESRNIYRFLAYKEKNPSFYSKYADCKIGNLQNDLVLETNKLSSRVNGIEEYHNDRVYFTDTLYNIQGYYYWSVSEVSTEKRNEKEVTTIKLNLPYLNIVVYSEEIEGYLTFIDQKVTDYNTERKSVYGCKIFSLPSDDDVVTLRTLEFIFGKYTIGDPSIPGYRESLFNKNLRMVFDRAMNVHFHPEKFIPFGQCRASFLLHGPGGTGKSDVVRRIALSTGRHIVEPEIVGMSKYQVEQCFRAPPIRQTPNKITTADIIIYIGEIDILLEELMRRELLLAQIEQLPIEKEEEGLSSLLSKISKGESSSSSLTSRSKAIEELKKKIILSELLEIFQGSVPYSSLILIATTNNYEKMISHPVFGDRISKIFRPGRMTPVYCGNINREILDEITMYHFSSPFGWGDVFPSIDLEKHQIGISAVLQLIEGIKLEKKGTFDDFRRDFFALIESQSR